MGVDLTILTGMDRARTGLVLGVALLLLTLVLPAPGAMPAEAWRVAGVAMLMAAWWVTEAVPIPATALVPLVAFPVERIMAIGDAAKPYADPVIFLFMGGFLIAAAMQRCGLHTRIALTIIRIGGVSPTRLVGSFMGATAFLSMWVSNTATAAMMLPIALSVLALAREQGQKEGGADPNLTVALLLGLAYSASLGGLGTLIGTPPNALLAGLMSELYGVQVGFLQWMLTAVPLVIIAVPLTWFVLTRVVYPVQTTPIAGGRAAIDSLLRALGPPSRAEWLVGIITALTAIAWMSRPLLAGAVAGLSDSGIAMTGALLLFVASVFWPRNQRPLDWAAAQGLPWGVLVLFGGGLSLASAIQGSGLAVWIGEAMTGLGAWPVVVIVLVVITVIVFMTELTSNTATAAALLPVVAALAVAVGLEPLLLAVPTALASSCAFMMPVATPGNALVYGSGQVTMTQMMRAGIVMNVLLIVLLTLLTFLLVPLTMPIG
jgi:sodium-dependent dicarboxylate transporter 2/3/5